MHYPTPQATTTRWHTKEGSFINRSLLALGGVIAKLAEGNAAHVPFRDSKLTRVLASSLTGSGARIAVVCTVTPGSAQAEETHNTLKFATRAKKARQPHGVLTRRQRGLFGLWQTALLGAWLGAAAGASHAARFRRTHCNIRLLEVSVCALHGPPELGIRMRRWLCARSAMRCWTSSR